MGIIDTLSAGFAVVNRRLLVIALPIALDLFLWLGPRLSVGPLVANVLSDLEAFTLAGVDVLETQPQIEPAQIHEMVQYFRSIGEDLGQLDLFGLLAWQMPGLTPFILEPNSSQVLGIASVLGLLFVVVALLVGGIVISACFLEALAGGVRDEQFAPDEYLTAVVRKTVRLLWFFVLLGIASIMLGFPVAFIISLIGSLSAEVAALLVLFAWSGIIVLVLLLYFVADAIFVGDVQLSEAIQQSVHLVRENFWPAVGLVGISMIILRGTPIAWTLLIEHPIGIITAIVGNGYVASGIAAASMIFYRDRLAKTVAMVEA